MATQQDLIAAKKAYQDLVLGRMPRVVVDQNGERIEYNGTNVASLKKYIAELERELGTTQSGPMRVWF